MSLVTLAEALEAAERGRFGVGAFNVFNMEMAQAVVAAAEAERSPVILLIYDTHQDHLGLEVSAALCRALAEQAKVPVVLHLDHGATFERVVRSIQAGYTGVMFDGSRLPLAENIAATRQVAEIARICGVSVEGEIGHVGVAAQGDGNKEEYMTKPEEARAFVEQTGVDCLAVAIGNAHGFYPTAPKLDFGRLEAIRRQVGIPLVLHGSTGIPDDDLRTAVELGVRKVNIGTDVMTTFGACLKAELAGAARTNGLRELQRARQAVQERVQNRMRVLGSAGKA